MLEEHLIQANVFPVPGHGRAPRVRVVGEAGLMLCLASPGVASTLMHISLVTRVVSPGVGSTLVYTASLRAFGKPGLNSGVELSSEYSFEDDCICLLCRPRWGV